MNHTASTSQKAPGEYFDETSFKTLYGGVFITWVTTSIIVDLLGFTDPKVLGLIIALLVAFIGFFMSENRSVKKLVVTPFNGFLIYLTIMGGTSFLPPPVPYDPGEAPAAAEEVNGVPGETGETDRSRGPALFRSWNPDQQLVEATRQLQTEKEVAQRFAEQHQRAKLAAEREVEQLQSEKQRLSENQEQLQNLVRRYEVRLDSTRRVVQNLQLSPQQQQAIMPMFQMERPNIQLHQ